MYIVKKNIIKIKFWYLLTLIINLINMKKFFKEIKFVKIFFFTYLNAISVWNFSSINIFNDRDQIIEPKHYLITLTGVKFLNLREYHI